MITKEFKSVVVLFILGDIVGKKRFSLIKKNIYIVSLRGNLTSYPHNNISFVLLDPKTNKKLASKCCS